MVSARLLFARVIFVLLIAVTGLGAPISGAAPPDDPQLRIDKHEHEPNELLVKFHRGAPARDAEAAMRGEGAHEVRSFKRPRKLASSPIDHWRRVKLAPGTDIEKVRARLLKNPHVEKVEYNYKVSTTLTPNDPRYPELWGLNNIGQTGGKTDADIDAPEAWDTQTGSQVVVAVIDSGVDYTHPDLAANMWTNPGEIPGNGIDDDGNGYIDDVHGYNFVANNGNPFDDGGHGTHVAGTIAAVGNNGIGVVGVAWQARIMALKFLDNTGAGTIDNAIAAILYATDMGAKVMNNSWGGYEISLALNDAIGAADMAGSLFVAAAGNDNLDIDTNPFSPAGADVPNVLAVAATNPLDGRAFFSNYGATTVHLAAPGLDILSTVPTAGRISDPSGYRLLSGTSMAAPHVSGAAALLFAQYPGITHYQVKERLINTVEPLPALQGKTVTGGRLHIVFEDDTTPPAAAADLAVSKSGAFFVTLSWSATGDDDMSGSASYYDLRYSTAPIDESNFAAATRANTPFGLVPVQGPAGTLESYTIKGLEPDTHYFFALKIHDNAGNPSPLSNLADTTTQTAIVFFSDDFESGGAKWTILGSDGNNGPALWHLSTHRFASPTTAFYYGKESTLNYDTGKTNWGSITSEPINLRGTVNSVLTFNYFLETENRFARDTARVLVSEDNGLGLPWTIIGETWLSTGGMIKENISLAAYDGKIIRLMFWFDTKGALANNFEGAVLDDVQVLGDRVGPTPPVAHAGGPYKGVTGQTIQFNGSASYDPNDDALTYTWDFGDGTDGTGVAPTHAYAAKGAYTVTLIANDGSFNSAPATATVNVGEAPIANAGGPYTAQRNVAITLNGSGSSDPDGDALTYTWDFGDGTSGTGVSPTHVYAAVGTYTATLTVNDGLAGTVATTTVTVANQPPVANPSAPSTGVIGQVIQFNGSGSSDLNQDTLSYAWSFGDGATGIGVSPTHAYAAKGSYAVTLVVNDGSVDSAPATTTVNIVNQAPIANAGGPYSVQRNVALTFDGSASTDPDGDSLTYLWDFGDGTSGTGATPTHLYSVNSTYTVTLKVNDGVVDSTVATTTVTVLFNAKPVANSGGPYSGQKKVPITFDASGSYDPNGDPLTYRWFFGDNTVFGTGVKPTHTYAASGTYTVTLEVNDGWSITPVTTTVTVANTPPVANAGGPYTANKNISVTLNGAGSSDANGDALTYAWNFGDGTSAAGQKPAHTYTAAGTYTVTLTVNDGEVNSAASTTTVTVTNQPPLAKPGGPYNGQKNQPVSFNGAQSSDPSNDPLTYRWDFGDGSALGSGATPSHTYTKGGTYTVTLIVNDGTVDSAPAGTMATVANTAPVASLTGPFTINKQGSVTFNGSASADADSDALTFNWTFGDGAVLNNGGPTPTHTYTTAGTHTVSLTVNDGETSSAPASTTVTVINQPPAANAGPDRTVTQRSPATLNGTASSDPDGAIAQFAWRQVSGTAVTLNGANTASAQFTAPAVKGATPLQLVFELKVTDNDGATATDQVAITVVK